ncbi:MAG: response regulator transcription factor [Bacteroidales bacterium]|nr:response regulator transcription factor [Bacteroidales bacterium]
MKIVIIEDEYQAQNRLQKLIAKHLPQAELVAILDSIESSVQWFSAHHEPDLIFSDIQLSDGLSFKIFQQIEIRAFVVFTTAYDEYAIEAFKLNSIDYLLKPVSEESFEKSLQKYRNLTSNKSPLLDPQQWLNLIEQRVKYKCRFLVDIGQSIGVIEIKQIAYFALIDKQICIVTHEMEKYPLKDSLDKIEAEIEPHLFYRINRQILLSAGAIRKIHLHFNYKLKLELNPPFDEDIIVSKAKVAEFKAWLSGF